MNQPPVVGRDGVARPYIGGQALIEGVMMRSPHSYAAVLRRRGGALMVREEAMGEDDPRGARWDDVVARFGPAPEAGPGDGP